VAAPAHPVGGADRAGLPGLLAEWRNRLVMSPRFQALARRWPLMRWLARREAERLHDLMTGFLHSQVLLALVETGTLARLSEGARGTGALAVAAGLEPAAMERLARAGVALGLLEPAPSGGFRLGRLGAAVLGVPGLEALIHHHRIFYADLSDPVALLRGETEPELARFWPYVRGEAAGDPARAARYSDLMAASQALVAEETLRTGVLDGARHLADIGGGSGAFLSAVAARYPEMRLTLFDLPEVAALGARRLAAEGLAQRVDGVGGDFRADSLPRAEAISFVRVFYDHDDATQAMLLAKAQAALPPGGRVVISEPMSGGDRPSRAGDVYFGFYTLAMTSGRPRSPATHAAALAAAGFVDIRHHRKAWPVITSVISARKQAGGAARTSQCVSYD